MGVVKNIIPAIASTNALISAACVSEVIKILTGCNHVLDNYMQFMGQTGVNTTTYQSERLDDCLVCSIKFSNFTFEKTKKLSEVIEHIIAAE
jgi:ubiquitin-activating enzyme E1 C